MNPTYRIHPSDNVAVALHDLPGIPAGHKVALCDLQAGELVVKYGFPIGRLLRPVAKGALIDHNNLHTCLEGTLDYRHVVRQPGLEVPVPPTTPVATFQGYLRPDGQAGIRNELWVIPTVGCVSGICQRIVSRLREEIGEKKAEADAVAAYEVRLTEFNDPTRKIGC